MKRFITLMLTAVLTVGSFSVARAASVFVDINTVPWPGAADFINEAQSIGLMSGYDEGGKKYAKPRNNVTYCESLQLIYSIMRAYSASESVSTADITKWSQVLEAYNVPSWAYDATVYALENGIIESAELTKLSGGTKNATREEVGVYFGRAVSLLKKVDINATLSYRDNASISKEAVPYLALLNSMKIMVGDDQNNFNPKALINRAEMAVLSVKTYKAIVNESTGSNNNNTAETGTITGTVGTAMKMSNGDMFLVITTSTGSGLNLFAKALSTTVTYDGQTVNVTDIGEGDTVKFTYSGADIKTLEITKSVSGINTATLVELEKLTSSKITVKESTGSKAYTLADKVTVNISGSKSNLDNLMSKMDNEEYLVTLTFDSSGKVERIDATLSKDNPLSGSISKLTDSQIVLKVGNKTYTYPLSDGDITIKYNSTTMTFTQLQKAYADAKCQVTVSLNSSGKVTAITVTYMEDDYNGTLTFINSKRLEISTQGRKETYDLDSSDITVRINGKTAKLSDLIDNYKNTTYTVALSVDRDDVVTKIEATTQNAEYSKGTITSLSNSQIKIKVDGKEYTYSLSSPTVKIDGTTISLSTLRSNYDKYTYDVELAFDSSGRVTAITGVNESAASGTVTGVIASMDANSDTLRVDVAGVRYKYTVPSNATIRLDGSNSTLSKIEDAFDDGDTVTVEVRMSSGKVSRITATTDDDSATSTKSGTIAYVDRYEIELTNGNAYDFASSVDVTIGGKSRSVNDLIDAVDDLWSDEYITVKLTLNSSDEVTKVVATIQED